MPVLETTGIVRPDGTIIPDEPLPVGPVSIRTLEPNVGRRTGPACTWTFTDEEIAERRAALREVLGKGSPEEAEEMIRIIREV